MIRAVQLIKKFPALYGNRKFITEFIKSPPTNPVPSHINPIHNVISHFLKIHSNIITLFTLKFPNWSRTFGRLTTILYACLVSNKRIISIWITDGVRDVKRKHFPTKYPTQLYCVLKISLLIIRKRRKFLYFMVTVVKTGYHGKRTLKLYILHF